MVVLHGIASSSPVPKGGIGMLGNVHRLFFVVRASKLHARQRHCFIAPVDNNPPMGDSPADGLGIALTETAGCTDGKAMADNSSGIGEAVTGSGATVRPVLRPLSFVSQFG